MRPGRKILSKSYRAKTKSGMVISKESLEYAPQETLNLVSVTYYQNKTSATAATAYDVGAFAAAKNAAIKAAKVLANTSRIKI